MSLFTARSVSEIEAAIQAAKEGKSALDGIDNTSAASVWLALRNAIATVTNLHEQSFVGFADEIEARAKEIQPGIPRWYAAESLVFQYGDSLEYINGNLTYSVIDPAKQIVKLAASDKENGYLVLKVAKRNSLGVAAPLNAMELTAFTSYWSSKKFACTPLAIVSASADIARLTYRIGVDPTLIDPSTGQSLIDNTQYPVENAITAYLETFQSTRFNGVVRVAEITDVIQAVGGVVNPIAESVQMRANDGSFQDILATNNDEYLTRSGYIVPDTTAGFTLRDTLSYYNAG